MRVHTRTSVRKFVPENTQHGHKTATGGGERGTTPRYAGGVVR
jgi:hypothetical protein